MQLETLKIKHARRGFVIINKSDFDESKHELFIEGAKPPAPKKRGPKPKVKTESEEAAE